MKSNLLARIERVNELIGLDNNHDAIKIKLRYLENYVATDKVIMELDGKGEEYNESLWLEAKEEFLYQVRKANKALRRVQVLDKDTLEVIDEFDNAEDYFLSQNKLSKVTIGRLLKFQVDKNLPYIKYEDESNERFQKYKMQD